MATDASSSSVLQIGENYFIHNNLAENVYKLDCH
jgi:hypothetical protein